MSVVENSIKGVVGCGCALWAAIAVGLLGILLIAVICG